MSDQPLFEQPDRRRIFLMRHGEAAYVRPDGTITDDPRRVGLTEQGRVQARKQAAVLASVAFDRAICSGLRRTAETAGIVLAERNWRCLLLVLHGAVNRMIFNYIMGTPWQARMSIEQNNFCINIIDVDSAGDGGPDRFLIRGVNLTGYDLNKSGFRLTTMEETALRLAERLED